MSNTGYKYKIAKQNDPFLKNAPFLNRARFRFTKQKILTKVLSKINGDCSKNKQNVYTLLKDMARPNFSTTVDFSH
jgi:hypothetical protein